MVCLQTLGRGDGSGTLVSPHASQELTRCRAVLAVTPVPPAAACSGFTEPVGLGLPVSVHGVGGVAASDQVASPWKAVTGRRLGVQQRHKFAQRAV